MDSDSLKSMAHDNTISDEKKIAEVGRQFEGVMLKMFLNDSLKPMIEGALKESGSTGSIYRHFLTDIIADSMTQGQGMGFSSVLQSQFQRDGVVENPESSNLEQ